MTEKLAIKIDEPERGKVIPIPMDRLRWMLVADLNNTVRAQNLKRCWYRHEIEDLYAELHPA